jgi:hypothetical protein
MQIRVDRLLRSVANQEFPVEHNAFLYALTLPIPEARKKEDLQLEAFWLGLEMQGSSMVPILARGHDMQIALPNARYAISPS